MHNMQNLKIELLVLSQTPFAFCFPLNELLLFSVCQATNANFDCTQIKMCVWMLVCVCVCALRV